MSDQTQIDAINAAVAAARAAAGQAVAPLAAANSNVPAVAQAPVGGRPVSMREMVQEAGVRADHFLKVDKPGFLVGKDTKTYLEEIEVEFRLDAAKAYWGIRFGNPAKYLKSYDRLLDSRTKKSWAQCIAEAAQADPRCTGDYPAVELAMVSVKEIKSKSGETLVEPGQTLGWNSSITNWSLWTSFIEPYFNLMDAGVVPSNALVRGKIFHNQKTANGNTWGLVSFQDFQVVADAQAAAAA